jgi:hypothetical protein
MQDNAGLPPDNPCSPYFSVYQTLTGHKTKKPRRKAAKHLYADKIKDELDRKTKAAVDKFPGAKRVDLWQKALDKKWKKLSQADRDSWQALSDKNFEDEMKEWTSEEKEKETGKSRTPEESQRYVVPLTLCFQYLKSLSRALENLASFMKPILDVVCDIAGVDAVLMFGGPEPAKKGQINMYT